MKILYMGTPDFAVLPLKKLVGEKHEILGVITREDKPKGRGMKVLMTPVKEYALTEHIPVFQPSTVKDNAIADLLRELNPEIIIVVAYGKILPEYILKYPKYGCVNLHASLLPRYRGSAPIQHAVLNGDEVTGVTTMFMDKGMDTGDILLKEEVKIEPNDTSESMFEKLSVVGSDLLIRTVNSIVDGTITRTPQQEKFATYAPPIKKEDARIDWSKTASEISNLVRGSFSWPIAYTESNIGRIKVYSVCEGGSSADCGKVISVSDKGLEVGCGDKTVLITRFQVESGKRMTPAEYFRGHESIVGSYLK